MLGLLLLLAVLAVSSTLALPPVPPRNPDAVKRYIDTHGETLLQEYARASLAKAHPGGKNAASADTVLDMASRMVDHLAAQDPDVQAKELAYFHSQLKRMNGAQ